MPGVTGEMLARTMAADYQRIKTLSHKIATILNAGNEAHITTPAGTNLTMSLKGRAAHPDTGMLQERGSFSNLPAGEAYIAPMEGTSNGVLVIDGAMSGIGTLNGEVIHITVKDGYANGIQGGQAAEVLSDT